MCDTHRGDSYSVWSALRWLMVRWGACQDLKKWALYDEWVMLVVTYFCSFSCSTIRIRWFCTRISSVFAWNIMTFIQLLKIRTLQTKKYNNVHFYRMRLNGIKCVMRRCADNCGSASDSSPLCHILTQQHEVNCKSRLVGKHFLIFIPHAWLDGSAEQKN